MFYCVDSKWPIIYIFFYEKQKVIRDKIIHKTISINKMYYIILLVVRLYPLLGCRRAHVLFMLYVFVWFVFTPYLVVGGLMSYLLGCRRAHVLFMLYVFVWFVFTPYLAVGGLMSFLCYMCLFGSSLPLTWL